jgi:hypothetical protein
MIRSIFAAAGAGAAGLLIFAAPASADDPPPPPPPQLPSLTQLGFDPSLTVCASTTTPIPFIGIGGCSPNIAPYFGVQ